MTSMGFGSGLEMERKGWGWHGEAGCGETGMQPRTDGGSNEEGRGGARMQKPHGSVCASGKTSPEVGLGGSLGEEKEGGQRAGYCES